MILGDALVPADNAGQVAANARRKWLIGLMPIHLTLLYELIRSENEADHNQATASAALSRTPRV